MTQKRCAYLTMEDPGDFVTDYHLSYDAMSALGWQVDTVVWQDPCIDWNNYDAVYICTPWDYPQHLDRFIDVLETIDASSACLVNHLSLVRWSLTKTYLRDLEARGAALVPSRWCDDIDLAQIPGWFDSLGTSKIVIKPVVGANAMDTYVLENPLPAELIEQLMKVFRQRPFFVQPFIENIKAEGEYSLFFFGGEYSHAILKTPQAGDFRVQEEHGADIQSVAASADLIATAKQVLSLVEPQPVYVRADFVRGEDDQFLLMELELIEPSLYFRTNDGAAIRFAEAFDRYVGATSVATEVAPTKMLQESQCTP